MNHHSTPSIPNGYDLCPGLDGDFGASRGPLYRRRDGGGFALRFELNHRNVRGVIHGGALITLADQVLGLTVQQAIDGAPTATVSLSCDLVASAEPGDMIEGEAQVTRVIRSLVFVRGTLGRGERVILTASGLWKRLHPGYPAG